MAEAAEAHRRTAESTRADVTALEGALRAARSERDAAVDEMRISTGMQRGMEAQAKLAAHTRRHMDVGAALLSARVPTMTIAGGTTARSSRDTGPANAASAFRWTTPVPTIHR